MSRLLIAPFAAIDDAVRRHRPSHLLTLMVEPHVPTPESISPERHLRITVHDIVEPSEGAVCPDSSHVMTMLSFARDWNRAAPLLVHCWAGISRSTAAAYILLNDLHGPGYEDRIARGLRHYAPHAQPNRLMIRHADELLDRRGRMIEAVEAMGEARPAWQGEIVDLPLTLSEL